MTAELSEGRISNRTLDADGTLQLLAAALAGTPSLPGAKCRTLFAAFDPAEKGEPPEEVEYRHTIALSLCRTCPALASCAEWIESHPPTRRPQGVIAARIYPRPAAVTTQEAS